MTQTAKISSSDARLGQLVAGPFDVKTRRKYLAVDRVMTNGQHTACFLVDRVTGDVYSTKAYGVPNYKVGTLENMTATPSPVGQAQ